jgi:hypothetical protein
VGIWYGAWSADDFKKAEKLRDAGKLAAYLNTEVPEHEKLVIRIGEKARIGKREIDTIRRFIKIPEEDWVVVCIGAKRIALARVKGPLDSDASSDLNRPHPGTNEKMKEIWKFRRLTNERLDFEMARLPDFYRLIPQAGRGNIFTLSTYQGALKILADCKTHEGVRAKFEAMTPDERLDLLGPKEWESFCLGYLIIEEHFLPTGLVIGGTLKALDIVGRDRCAGLQILAQCKKNKEEIEVEEEFRKATEGLEPNAKVFYFAYGGCKDKAKYPHIRVIGKKEISKWAEAGDGKKYIDSFFIENR